MPEWSKCVPLLRLEYISDSSFPLAPVLLWNIHSKRVSFRSLGEPTQFLQSLSQSKNALTRPFHFLSSTVLTLCKWQEVTDQRRAVCQYRNHSIGILLFKPDAFLGTEVFSSNHNAHTLLRRISDGEGSLTPCASAWLKTFVTFVPLKVLMKAPSLGMPATSWVTSLVRGIA